jgi:6-pyruvoyltetrahydropterin/6-carboxytetrahydropterin synthase
MSMRLEIDGEHVGIKFSACHFIARHEKCGRLHGHTYVISLRLEGEGGDGGMLVDFGLLKKALRSLAEELDHRALMPARSRDIEITVANEVTIMSGAKRYIFPREDVLLLPIMESSAEELAKYLLERLRHTFAFPGNVSHVELGIHEELGQSAWVEVDL